jgi:hypothetical protein
MHIQKVYRMTGTNVLASSQSAEKDGPILSGLHFCEVRLRALCTALVIDVGNSAIAVFYSDHAAF